MEELPSEAEVVIIGTGLPECMIAAACSRIDKQILQLDKNDFYGSNWAGFQLKHFRQYLRSASQSTDSNQAFPPPLPDGILSDGETAIPIGPPMQCIRDHEEVIYLTDGVVEPDIAPMARKERYRRLSGRLLEESRSESSESERSRADSSFGSSTHPTSGDVEMSSSVSDPELSSPTSSGSAPMRRSFEELINQSKKFSLDISPKLFWTSDSFVELLKNSNVSRYCTFRLVNSIGAFVNGQVFEVPFSRSSLASLQLGIKEKRRLMKFMEECLSPGGPEKPDVSVGEYMRELNIPDQYASAIITAVVMDDQKIPMKHAAEKVKRFLSCCGQYKQQDRHQEDSGPFLFPMYGVGEYPQYFARISAIFGGIQCLKRDVEYLVLNASGAVNGIISGGQKVRCGKVVLPVHLLPKEFRSDKITSRVTSRAVLITNKSLFSDQNSQAGYLRIRVEQSETESYDIHVVEASSGTEVCPEGYFVHYMWASNKGTTAKAQLEPFVLKLFEPFRADLDNILKPVVYWACYYNAIGHVFGKGACKSLARGVAVVDRPSDELDLEDVAAHTSKIFGKMFPDDAFLPRCPDPEDVIIGENDRVQHLDVNVT